MRGFSLAWRSVIRKPKKHPAVCNCIYHQPAAVGWNEQWKSNCSDAG